MTKPIMTARPPTYAKHVGRSDSQDETQLDIFSTAEPIPKAHKRRVLKAHKPTAQHVVEPVAGWTDLAVNAIRLYVRTAPSRADFIFEELRMKVEAGLPALDDLRAWGNVPRICIKRGILVERKGKFRADSNRTMKRVYMRGPFA